MNIFEAQERVRPNRAGVRLALAHLAERQHRLITRCKHIGAEHFAPGARADSLPGLRTGAHPNSAKTVRDIGLLAAGSVAVPRLGRDNALGIVDQEIPAPAGSRDAALYLVVESVDLSFGHD